MKKKIFASLLAIMLAGPMIVSAATYSMPIEQTEAVEGTDGLMTYEVEVYLQLDEGDTLSISTLDVTWVPNEEGVELIAYDASSEFTGLLSGDEVTLTATDGIFELEEGDKVSLGTFTIQYDDSEVDDCGGTFETEYVSTDVDIEENVQTGINIPLVAIGAAGILAVGIYLTISKKNKIYNV